MYSSFAKNRDVSFIKIEKDLYLAVACDSCGGIGNKEKDVVKVPPYIVGRFTTRVSMMELLSIGASPKGLTAAVCSEPKPTGEGLVSGIFEELKQIDEKMSITISTEKNMPTCQTGLGITAIGTVNSNSLKVNKTRALDKLYCIGIPKVGNEISLEDPELADITLIKKLLKHPKIHDIIPVGSKGIKGETNILASYLKLEVIWRKDIPLDLNKTAGPCTCVLITSPEIISLDIPQPVFLLGEFAKWH